MGGWALIIDEKGKFWSPSSLSLRANYHAMPLEDDFTRYAVCNLGFIEVRRHNKTTIVSLRTKAVSEIAIVELCYYLTDYPPERLALATWCDNNWRIEIQRNTNVMIQNIFGLVALFMVLRSTVS